MNAPPPAHRSTSATAVVSLVFGVLTWFLLPVIGAVVAIVCGHLARSEIRRSQQGMEGDGLAIAGLVLGYAQLVLGVLLVGFLTIALMFGLSIGLSH
ncbi:DUF4190 domain-containing protein [Frateuria sp. MAH-13]|uniref:DUF4190 domain-containing protein n=1 Tax=Frateuria flava TaxID=2821489 RepID=A0ABS4DS10_9GAMM|nr:DUF4190 domain-containing protein [Frateuria flava]MBP1475856.1 DUF4190 domain-containing protein [Frateuria flava]